MNEANKATRQRNKEIREAAQTRNAQSKAAIMKMLETVATAEDATTEQKLSAYFVLFIWCALFNGFNVRDEGFAIFKGLNENTGFLKVFATIILVQAAIVNAGLIPATSWVGSMFSCVPFGPAGWCVVAVLAVTMIPVDLLRKVLSRSA